MHILRIENRVKTKRTCILSGVNMAIKTNSRLDLKLDLFKMRFFFFGKVEFTKYDIRWIQFKRIYLA